MDNIEIIDTAHSLENYSNFIIHTDETLSESANYISKRNKSAFLKYLIPGTMLIVSSYQDVIAENFNITESCETIDSYLNSYNKAIDLPISQFLNEVNEICSVPKFFKKEIIKEILSFKSLNNNWDGFDAIPLEIESATNAIMLLDLIGEQSFNKINEFFPNPNGTISFIWSNDSDEIISLEIGNSLMSYYVELNSKETVFYNNIAINDKEIKKLFEFIQIL
ncbi:MAG: hypothetical protein U0W24_18555 [Bacteroidales bacterium]